MGFQLGMHLDICLWHDILDHAIEIRATEELQASLSLCFPQVAVGIDDAIS